MDTELTDLERADQILEIIGNDDEGAEEQPPKQPKTTKTEDTAAETPSGEMEDETDETAQDDEPGTVIAPPATWNAELKAKWTQLPPDLQQELAQWESGRNKGVGAKLNEAAEIRKAAEAEKQAAATERAKFAQLAEYLSQNNAGIDPVIADAQRTDWNRLAIENPAEWAAKRQAVETRARELATIEQERQSVLEQSHREQLLKSQQKLEEAIPEWKDQAKRTELQKKLAKTGEAYGYTPQELSQLVNHRDILVLKDAMAYREMMAAQKSAAEKKVAPPTTQRVIKPAARSDNTSPNERVKALQTRARRSGKESDAVNAVLATIGD